MQALQLGLYFMCSVGTQAPSEVGNAHDRLWACKCLGSFGVFREREVQDRL